MRRETDLRHYQQHALQHVLDHPYAGLFLGMGLGKTATTLTAIQRLKYDLFDIDKVLIIAPKRVAETVWHTEAKQWEHLQGLTFSLVLGDERKRKEALQAKADVYVINRENVVWLCAYLGGRWPFDLVVIDESSSFKSHSSQRFKALKVLRPRIKRVVELTGTPMGNGLLDLWPQLYLLDMGERLGKTIGGYREKYFKPGKRNGHIVYEYNLRKGDDIEGEDIYEREVFDKIGDICISMQAKDYLDLPERLDQLVEIDMPADIQRAYDDFERTQVLSMAEGLKDGEISAVNAAALTGKLLQFANGAVYREDHSHYEVHTLKLDALAEDVEAANGEPFLLFYQFQSDVERICKHLKHLKPYVMDKRHTLRDVERWNRKEIPFMLLHAKSGGHGLNMQQGGHLIGWFGRPWSLEEYLQAVARLDRQGQTQTVVNRSYVMRGTMEEDLIKSTASKEAKQDALLRAVKARVSKYLGK
jgi:SNF2 family DNA or RNA helicase